MLMKQLNIEMKKLKIFLYIEIKEQKKKDFIMKIFKNISFYKINYIIFLKNLKIL